MLFGIVVVSMILLAVVAVAAYAEWPLVTATLWHIHNGNTVEFEGHSFHVPLLYEPEVSNGGKEIDLTESPRLFTNGASVIVEAHAKVFDAVAAHAWQSNLQAELVKHRNDKSQSAPLTLYGKKLTFVCVNIGLSGDALLCHAVGTDLTVSTSALPAYVKETRAMLETSE